MLAEFIELIDKVKGASPAFGSDQLAEVLEWSVPIHPMVRARVLSALSSAEPDATLIAACARAIAELDDWRGVAVDLLHASEPSSTIISIFRDVLQFKQVDHPLTSMSRSPRAAVAVYNGRNLPEGVLVTGLDPADAVEWLLLDAMDPIEHFSFATAVLGDEGAMLVGMDVPWLDRHRAVCPAFYLLSSY